MREILQLCGLISEKGELPKQCNLFFFLQIRIGWKVYFSFTGFTDEEGRRAILFGELFDIYRFWKHL